MPLDPDRHEIELFTDALFRHASKGGFVSLRGFSEGESTKAFRITAVAIGSTLDLLNKHATEFAGVCANQPKGVVFCPPIATFRDRKGAKETDIAEGLALSVECDRNPRQAKAQLEAILGPATVTVLSGGKWTDPANGEVLTKLHLHWRLGTPATGEVLKSLKQARDIAARLVGGDPSNKPVCHPIRWPGSWHRKGEPVLCQIETANADCEIDLAAALAALEAAAPPDRSRANGQADARDDAGRAADWTPLIAGILSGADYHNAVTVLAAKMIAGGTSEGAAVNLLRAMMEASTAPHDGRWAGRYADIPRAVSTAREKFGQTAASAGAQGARKAQRSNGAAGATESIHSWEQPDWSLIEDRRGDLPEFPLDVFSAGWQAWALKTSHGAGTSPAHVMVPLLGIASGVVGVARRVQVSRSWIEPMAMWTALVGLSGSGKTPGIDASKRPLALIEKDRRSKIDAQRRAHDEKVDVAKIALKTWKKQVEEAAKKGEPRPAKPRDADDPGTFIAPRIYVSDTTIERLAMLIEARPCGLLLLADELSGLFLNMGRYNSGRDNEFWLEAWNGKSFLQERVGRKPISVDHLMVGLTGGLQPDKLARSFEGDLDGMYARILFGWPNEAAYRELTDVIAEVEPEIVNALMRLVRMGDPDEDGTFAPRNIAMSTAGRDVFEGLRQRVFEGKAALDGRERDWWAKVPAHVARLAGTLTLIDWALAASAPASWKDLGDLGDDPQPEPSEIDAAHVMAAVKLVLEYFWPHARAALRQIGLTERHANARRVLRWIAAKGLQSVSSRDVRRDGLAQSLDADGTQAVLEDIERAGWFRQVVEKPGPTGGRPSVRWEVNPQLLHARGGA